MTASQRPAGGAAAGTLRREEKPRFVSLGGGVKCLCRCHLLALKPDGATMKTNSAQLFTCAMWLAASVGCGHSASELLPLVATPASPPRSQTWEEADLESQSLPDQPLALPFPERENPFLFPHDRVEPVQPAAKVNEVRVLGFVHVDQPRVLLRVTDLTRTLAVGDKTQGVEVLAIEPPTVRLRQGNLTWTASLFDRTD